MKHEANIAPDASRLPDAADYARAKVMYAAGEGVAHVVFGQWLLTWGQPGFKDFPEWLHDQNG